MDFDKRTERILRALSRYRNTFLSRKQVYTKKQKNAKYAHEIRYIYYLWFLDIHIKKEKLFFEIFDFFEKFLIFLVKNVAKNQEKI